MEGLKDDVKLCADIASLYVHQFRYKFQKFEDDSEDAEGKIVVVTGANGGIGLGATEELVRRKAIVIMCCRSEKKTQQAIQSIKKIYPQGQMIPVELDLSNFDSVRRCAREIKEKVPHINVLINNAGIMWNKPEIERTAEGFETQFATNHLGHFLLTLLLVKHLKKGAPSRIITLSSSSAGCARMDLDDLNWERKDRRLGLMNLQPYAVSKLANVLFSQELGKKLEGSGISTCVIDPGSVNTDLAKTWKGFWGFTVNQLLFRISITPKEASETILYCAFSKDVANETGKGYRFKSRWTPLDNQQQENNTALKLWRKSEEMAGIEWKQVV